MTTRRNAQFGRTIINTVASIFNGTDGFSNTSTIMLLYPGAEPTEVAYLSVSSNTIVGIGIPTTNFTASGVLQADSHGTISKTGTWSGTVTSTNTVGWGLLDVSGQTSYCMIFSAGTAGTSPDMTFNDAHFIVDGTVVIDTCDIRFPPTP